jgi:hypothetical protein
MTRFLLNQQSTKSTKKYARPCIQPAAQPHPRSALPCVRNTSHCFLQAQWGIIMFLMVFGMAIRGYQLVCAFWEVVSADNCEGWKLLCFPCISVIWGFSRAESKRSESRRRRSSVGIENPHAEPQASQYFKIGRPLSHPLYGAGWAVGNIDGTFLVCFPDGSSAKYARHNPNVLPRALDRGQALATTRWCRYPKDELDADFTIDDPEAPTRPWVPAKSPEGFDQLGRIKAMFGADGEPSQPALPLPPVFHKYRGHGIVEELPLSRPYIQWLDTLSLMLTVRAASPCRRRQSSPAARKRSQASARFCLIAAQFWPERP